jgi:hypothetical protein
MLRKRKSQDVLLRSRNAGFIKTYKTERPWDRPSVLHHGYRINPAGNVTEAWRWPPTHIQHRSYRNIRATPLFPLWAFVTFLRVKFTFTFTSNLLGLTLFFITNKNYTNGYFLKKFSNSTWGAEWRTIVSAILWPRIGTKCDHTVAHLE